MKMRTERGRLMHEGGGDSHKGLLSLCNQRVERMQTDHLRCFEIRES